MSQRILLVTFAHEDDLLRTTRDFRARGLKILDAYTPYPVHGLDEALGLPPSRLSWACAALGAVATAVMYWFQQWTSAVDWPINVGGKPWDSLPAFAPVMFESMVLAAGIGTVVLFFLACRLWPGRKARLVIPEVTDDQFALVVEETDAAFDLHQLEDTLNRNRALLVEERIKHQEPPRDPLSPGGLRWINYGLAASLVVVVALAFLAGRDPEQRNWEVFPTMVRSPAYDAYAIQTQFAAGWGPPAGAVAQEDELWSYAATAEAAKQAGDDLTNPFAADDTEAAARGAWVYQNFCAACHGPQGLGDGPVAQRGFPPPPSFATDASRALRDGELFHIITAGRRSMPPHGDLLEPADRWKAILHVRQLQGKSP